MSSNSQREALSDALEAVHPSAPTLCEGWTAHHLAAHVWLRENDPVAALGMFVRPLAGQAENRMAEVMTQRPYPDLVAAIRRGPTGLSPFRLPGVEAAANRIEFFVHCEDVRRGGGVNTPRAADPAFENLAWKRVGPMARLLLRGCPVAVWLERDIPRGEPLRIGRGPDIVTILGRPSEILLFVSGRRSAADVEVIGEPAAVSLLHR
ncbi:MAG: TIGR03085 family protein [Propionibacteriaceae bacterium]|nr:TIGR03085 family protein [Propionibacteriaceae bacterium]